MNVVVVGAREREETERDQQLVYHLLEQLVGKHRGRLHLISVGCDKGVGRLVREYAIDKGLKFAEPRIKFEGKDIARSFFAHLFMARNRVLLEVGDEFYLFLGPNPNGIIEQLVSLARVRVGESRVTTYPYEAKGSEGASENGETNGG